MNYDQLAFATVVASLINGAIAIWVSVKSLKSSNAALELASSQRADPIALHIRKLQIEACQKLINQAWVSIPAENQIFDYDDQRDALLKEMLALEDIRVAHSAILPAAVVNAAIDLQQAKVGLWTAYRPRAKFEDQNGWGRRALEAHRNYTQTRKNLLETIRSELKIDTGTELINQMLETPSVQSIVEREQQNKATGTITVLKPEPPLST